MHFQTSATVLRETPICLTWRTISGSGSVQVLHQTKRAVQCDSRESSGKCRSHSRPQNPPDSKQAVLRVVHPQDRYGIQAQMSDSMQVDERRMVDARQPRFLTVAHTTRSPQHKLLYLLFLFLFEIVQRDLCKRTAEISCLSRANINYESE